MIKKSLERKITWKTGFFVTLTCVLDWFWLTGSTIQTVGKWAVPAWIIAVILQGLACVAYLEMASMFKDTSGGLPTYVHQAFKKYGELPGAIASWGYVLGWGAAPVAVVLFAGYFVQQAILPELNTTLFAVSMLFIVYGVNFFGVKVWSKATTLILITAFISLIVCMGVWFVPIPASQMAIGFGYVAETSNLVTFIGAIYIVAWTAYSSEAVLTLMAEYKDPVNDAKKALIVTVAAFLIGTVFVTLTYMRALSIESIVNEPFTQLLPLANLVAGHVGELAVMFAMVLGLLLSMNACFIASSRVLFQMGRDGTCLKQFGAINRYSSPHMALLLILGLNVFMITALGEQPLAIVRAGDVGYFATIILANVSAFMLRRQMPDAERPFRAPDFFIYLSLFIAGINIILVTVGNWSWGLYRTMVGVSLLLTILPLYYYRKLVQDKRSVLPGTPIPEEFE